MKKWFCFYAILVMVSCTHKKNEISYEYMSLDTMRYINETALSKKISKSEWQKFNSCNRSIINFCIEDSLLIAYTQRSEALFDIYNINDQTYRNSFFHKGNGEYELVMGANITQTTTFYSESDSLYTDIYDIAKGRVLSINITKFLSTKIPEYIIRFEHQELPKTSTFWAKRLGNSTYITRSIAEKETKQVRKIWSKDTIGDYAYLDILNRFQIPEGEGFNIMSSLVAVTNDGKRIVEAPLGLNYINAYSIFEKFGYSLCIDKTPYKLSNILETSRHNRKYVFADVRAYENGYAVLVYDIDESTYQKDEYYSPFMLFMNWDGEVKLKIYSDFKFNHFDIDVQKKRIYVLDELGEIYYCDIKTMLL